MTYATVQDVATSLGRPISDSAEVAQVETWLADAEMRIRRRLGDLPALIAADQLDAEALVYVEREAVIRKLNNPDGKVSEDIDDYRYRRNPDAARGAVFVTDEEWALLLPPDALPGVYVMPLNGSTQ